MPSELWGLTLAELNDLIRGQEEAVMLQSWMTAYYDRQQRLPPLAAELRRLHGPSVASVEYAERRRREHEEDMAFWRSKGLAPKGGD